MRIIIFQIILGALLIGCKDNRKRTKFETIAESQKMTDSIVRGYDISDEVSGSAYRKSGICYFVVVGNDTSNFNCIFSESKDGKVNISLKIPYQKEGATHGERMKELKLILNQANNDFNFDSLDYIGLGRLILNGDLAVEITKEYIDRFGTNSKLMGYITMKEFFIDSKLVDDINEVFKSYSIKVEDVSLEKLFFTAKKELYMASKLETDSAKVPEKILDCMTWVKLTKK